jgi:hypothetical protein
MAFGTAAKVEDPAEKEAGLNAFVDRVRINVRPRRVPAIRSHMGKDPNPPQRTLVNRLAFGFG